MTGPEHYRKAEELLDYARGINRGSGDDASLMAEAQAHATLALAAATALSNGGAPDGSGGGMTLTDAQQWEYAASAYERPAPNPLRTSEATS